MRYYPLGRLLPAFFKYSFHMQQRLIFTGLMSYTRKYKIKIYGSSKSYIKFICDALYCV